MFEIPGKWRSENGIQFQCGFFSLGKQRKNKIKLWIMKEKNVSISCYIYILERIFRVTNMKCFFEFLYNKKSVEPFAKVIKRRD